MLDNFGYHVFNNLGDGIHTAKVSLYDSSDTLLVSKDVLFSVNSSSFCGDNICDTGEDFSCPSDCSGVIGDGIFSTGDNGYAFIMDNDFNDLNYNQSFSLESIIKIPSYYSMTRNTAFVMKGAQNHPFTQSGFGFGTTVANSESFGKRIVARVSDGTRELSITSVAFEGYAYVVMTWDHENKQLRFYVNNNHIGNAGDPDIIPENIKGIGQFRFGGTGFTGIEFHMARLWNRKLDALEIKRLWDNFNQSGLKELGEDFDKNGLHSEWLMIEGGNENGWMEGAHIKDVIGRNHLKLHGTARLNIAGNNFRVHYPESGSVGIAKGVHLNVSGDPFFGSSTKPLQYYFQIDEVDTFDSQNLKESGWAPYSVWSPILKPNTQYFWRVKVRDSGTVPKESGYIDTYHFTTKNRENWYFRSNHNNISNSDGKTYDTAWTNLNKIVWGAGGIEAGDYLYVCGIPIYNGSYWNHLGYIKVDGFFARISYYNSKRLSWRQGLLWG
jgi:hypothetical protein